MDKKICMITGANAGIGKAAAIQIAQQVQNIAAVMDMTLNYLHQAEVENT